MMTSSNGNIFRVTGPLCGEFTGHLWIPLTKASDAKLWYFLWSALCINGWVNNREAGDLKLHRVHYEVILMTNCKWLNPEQIMDIEIADHTCNTSRMGHKPWQFILDKWIRITGRCRNNVKCQYVLGKCVMIWYPLWLECHQSGQILCALHLILCDGVVSGG